MAIEERCPECRNTNGEHKVFCTKDTPEEWEEVSLKEMGLRITRLMHMTYEERLEVAEFIKWDLTKEEKSKVMTDSMVEAAKIMQDLILGYFSNRPAEFKRRISYKNCFDNYICY